ncbi:MAG: DUF3822 family protein [Bacteroides sp.]|nr:DUF3822 family protein [Bacteroides sp.]
MTGFDFNQSEQHLLSIRLSADGFSFSICHPQRKGDIFFVSWPVNASCSMTANLKDMIASTEAFRHTYRKVNVLIDTPRFTPIPFELFEDEQLETLFYHNFPPRDNETVLCNISGKSNTAILFGMDKHTHQLLDEQFPEARIFASVSPLVEHFAQDSRQANHRSLYAHLKKNVMEVFGYDRGKLLFINSFPCKQVADQVYYLLYVWQQLGFSQENDRLCLASSGVHQDALTAELGKFLRNITVLPTEQENISFDMQTLLICE